MSLKDRHLQTNSSQLYQKFDLVLLLSHGRSLYSGPGGFAPADYFSTVAAGIAPVYTQGYNVAEYLLQVASDPPVSLFQLQKSQGSTSTENIPIQRSDTNLLDKGVDQPADASEGKEGPALTDMYISSGTKPSGPRSGYETTFLTQLQYLCGREWKMLKRDKTLFLAHVLVSAILGVFCGEYFLYFHVSEVQPMNIKHRRIILPHRHHYRWVSIPSWVLILPGESCLLPSRVNPTNNDIHRVLLLHSRL